MGALSLISRTTCTHAAACPACTTVIFATYRGIPIPSSNCLADALLVISLRRTQFDGQFECDSVDLEGNAMRTELIKRANSVTLSLRTHTIKGGVEDNEEELVAAAKGGSHAAFEKLVGRYEARVFHVAQRIARSREDAEDVIQQSFQKAFVYLQRFEGRSSFSTWLTRIVLNEALMLVRAGRRFRDVSIDQGNVADDSALPLDIADSRPNPEHSYFEQERRRLLFSAINELTPGIRVALQICDLDELSLRETAGILGVSVAAVKSRVNRGRRVLREKLKQSAEAASKYGRGNGLMQAAQGNRKFQLTS
jgi:RNA polymerase sigma-70 factor, ECF subfamily